MAFYSEYRGVSELHYAIIEKDNNETGATEGLKFKNLASSGTTAVYVKPLAGIGELSKSTASSSATHYYDNGPRIIVDSTGADTLTLKTSVLSQEVLADLLGRHYDSSKGVMIESNDHDKAPYVAIGYKTEKVNDDGTITYMWVWRYKCKVGIPEENSKTRDDGTDAEGQTLAITCIETTHKFEFGTAQASDKHTAKAVYKETTTDVEPTIASKKWFTEVPMIDDVLA